MRRLVFGHFCTFAVEFISPQVSVYSDTFRQFQTLSDRGGQCGNPAAYATNAQLTDGGLSVTFELTTGA